MMEYRHFEAKLESLVDRLTSRQCAAWGATLTERVVHLLAEGCEPLDQDLAERALEVAWAFALGEAVSQDEVRWTMLALGDHIQDVASDCGPDLGVAEAALDTLTSIEPEDRRIALLHIADAVADLTDSKDYEPFATLLESLPPDAELVRPPPTDDTATERRARGRASRPEVIPPWREPSGLPSHLESREVGKTSGASEGIIATPGHRVFALFERGNGVPVFEREGAVGYGLSPDARTLFTWRVARREGVSGIARGHHDWIVEVHRWPERTLEHTHVVQTRKTSAWCWPLRLDVPANGVAVLRARSEDWVAEVAIAFVPDGPREYEDRSAAIADAR